MMRKKKSTQITTMILLVSFIILFGRLLYSAIAAIYHNPEQNQSQPLKQSNNEDPASRPKE